MKIRIRESKNINILDIEGRIDINSSEIIETIGWLAKSRKREVLLNFEKVDMVDYSGISILAIAYKNVLNHKGKMKFCNVALHIEELFKLVRLDSIFEVYKDERVAVKAFRFESPIDKKTLRRRFKRLDMSVDVEFLPATMLEEKNRNWYSGKLLNLSGEGMFLYTKKLLPLGKEIKIKIDLLSKAAFEAEGEVVWIADKSLQPQSYPGMGIYFKKMPKRNQDKMLTFINRHLIHRSAKL